MTYCFRLGCDGNGDANSAVGVTAIYHHLFEDGQQDLPNEAIIRLTFCCQTCEVEFLNQVLTDRSDESAATKNVLGEIIKTHRHWFKQNCSALSTAEDQISDAVCPLHSNGRKVYSVHIKVPTSWEAGVSHAVIELNFNSLRARLEFALVCKTVLDTLLYLERNSV
jgi:hypothetical protein